MRIFGSRHQDFRKKTSVLESYGTVESQDGTEIFYAVEGEGPPLVFCYGLACSSLHWTYQIDYFREHYQCIWFDYRGHGRSETPKQLSSLTIKNLTEDLDAVIRTLDLPPACILGHSMGVNVVLQYYRDHPERFSSMVLANGTAKNPLETLYHINIFQKAFQVLKKLQERSPILFKKLWQFNSNPVTELLVKYSGFNPHLTAAEDVAMYVKQVAKFNPAVFFTLFENYETFDATPWLHTISVPTLILAGENDHMTPLAQQETLHQLIPESELEILAHGSHCPQIDLPKLVNLRVEKFLRDHSLTS